MRVGLFSYWGFFHEILSTAVAAVDLLDTAYIASASIINVANPALRLFEPGTGRAVFAGMKYRW